MNSNIDLSGETVGWTEWGVVIAVALIAGVYLWRKFAVKKSCGCAGCGKAGSCGNQASKKSS